MIRLRISVDVKEATDILDGDPVGRAIRAWIPGSEIRGAKALQEAIMATTRSRTGRLRSDVGFANTSTGYVLVARAPYASFANDGTRPHEIRPRSARALAFPMAGGSITRSASTGHVRTKFKFGGKTTYRGAVFAMRVWHPGTAPRLFVEAAAELIVGQEPGFLEAALEAALGGQG